MDLGFTRYSPGDVVEIISSKSRLNNKKGVVVGCSYFIKVDDEERPMLINSNNVFPYKKEPKEIDYIDRCRGPLSRKEFREIFTEWAEELDTIKTEEEFDIFKEKVKEQLFEH